MINNAIVGGRLVADPEIRRTQSGVPVVSFRIACERDFKNGSGEREVDYINCVAWRNTAEFVSKFFTKGRMIIVQGRIEQREFVAKDGNNRQVHEVVADNVYFGDTKTNGGTKHEGAYDPFESVDSEVPF